MSPVPRNARSDRHSRRDRDGLDPWERFGWLMWSAWMIFLVFPFVAAVQSDVAPVWRWATVLVVVAFGTTYAAGSMGGLRTRLRWLPRAVVLVPVLVVLALLTVPAIGLTALSFVPFVQALGMFALPRPWNWVLSAAAVVVALALPWLTGDLAGWFYFTLIVLASTAGTGAGRLMADQGETYGRVQEELTVSAERERVARDVHDVLGHSLTVVTVKAELAEKLVDEDPAAARAELADIQALARQALAEIRATVGGLRAARLGDELEGAALALRAAGIDAEMPPDPDVLDPRHRTVVAWVLREAATNVVRHAGARHCRVELTPHALAVTDDGRGLAGSGPGNGLRGLRERVESSGGHFLLGPGPGGGTRLEVSW